MNYDLIVVGAGVSGMSAAIKASQMGAKVALIEKENYLGGVASRAFHVTLCGFFLNDQDNPFTLLNDGLSSVVVDDLIGSGVAAKKEIGKTEVLLTYPTALPALFDGYFERNNVELLLNTELISVNHNDNNIESVTVERSGETFDLQARSYLDASGSAILSELSAASILDVNERQLAALCAKVIDVDVSDSLTPVITSYNIRKIVEEFELFPEMAYSVVHGSHEGYLILKISVDPNRDYGQVLKAANKLVATLALRYDAWINAKVLEWSRGIVLRDDKRILGKAVLEHQQVLSAVKGEGSVKGAWPVEFWHINKGPRYEYLPQGDFYVIPDDCMRSNSLENLYAAGKSISADSYALASARVVGTAIATGERAAVLALNNGEGF